MDTSPATFELAGEWIGAAFRATRLTEDEVVTMRDIIIESQRAGYLTEGHATWVRDRMALLTEGWPITLRWLLSLPRKKVSAATGEPLAPCRCGLPRFHDQGAGAVPCRVRS